MTMPCEVKMELERRALELAVTIVGVHSVCLIDDDTVDAIFDIEPDLEKNLQNHRQHLRQKMQ